MALITRQGKGSKLTIQEMDENLEYLESLPTSGSTQWESDGEEKIRPKDGKLVDAQYIDNLSLSGLTIHPDSPIKPSSLYFATINDYNSLTSIQKQALDDDGALVILMDNP
jgi:hypothetical protein